MNPRTGFLQTLEIYIRYLFFENSLHWKHFVFNLSILPPYDAPPSFFSLSLSFSPHTLVLSGAGTLSSTELLFFHYSFGFCIFPRTRYFHFFKIWEKNNVVSINKSASRESHFLSRFQKCFMAFRSPVCANQRWCFTYAGYSMPTSPPALHCVPF